MSGGFGFGSGIDVFDCAGGGGGGFRWRGDEGSRCGGRTVDTQLPSLQDPLLLSKQSLVKSCSLPASHSLSEHLQYLLRFRARSSSSVMRTSSSLPSSV